MKRKGLPMKYNRTLNELEMVSIKWWPDYLKSIEVENSIVPLLLKTQDKFISILTLSVDEKPESIMDILNAASFPANLFLKHLMVLSDFGAEPLQRINKDFNIVFPKRRFTYLLNGKQYQYKFTALPVKGLLNNKKMSADMAGLLTEKTLTGFFKDLMMLLLYAGNRADTEQAYIFSKCIIGNMLGYKDKLSCFIKQRYIHVSRIIGGSQANDLGNAAQNYVHNYLKERLGSGYTLTANGFIPKVTQNEGRTNTTFDLVVSRGNKYIAVEISFQETTNSTIERKGGQARERFTSITNTGNYIAYVIDGAGNFQRKSAVSNICENSHCTVAYSNSEFELLLAFIQETIG